MYGKEIRREFCILRVGNVGNLWNSYADISHILAIIPSAYEISTEAPIQVYTFTPRPIFSYYNPVTVSYLATRYIRIHTEYKQQINTSFNISPSRIVRFTTRVARFIGRQSAEVIAFTFRGIAEYIRRCSFVVWQLVIYLQAKYWSYPLYEFL